MTNIIFDYDGALHNSIKIYAPAFRGAYQYLVSLGYAPHRQWADEEICKQLGYNSKDMWNTFMPHLPQATKDKCSSIIGDAMLEYVSEGKAELYPHSLQVLQDLRVEGYNLIF